MLKVVVFAGMCALAELVAAADSLYVRTGSDAIPLLRIGIWRLVLNLWRKQLGKRVRIMHLTRLGCFTCHQGRLCVPAFLCMSPANLAPGAADISFVI